jgi:V8-like Glu-specific endopeptidase
MEGRGPWTEISNDREELKDNERLLLINYRVYTSPGQSGSPIFYETKEKEHYMIGIHTMGGNEENCGVLITPKVREIVNGWIE